MHKPQKHFTGQRGLEVPTNCHRNHITIAFIQFVLHFFHSTPTSNPNLDLTQNCKRLRLTFEAFILKSQEPSHLHDEEVRIGKMPIMLVMLF